jgi:hypothetical protein
MLYATPLVARPLIHLLPSAGSAMLSGAPIASGVDERWLSQGRPIEFDITLQGDTFVPTVGDEDYGIGPTTALLSSVRSLQSSGSGYNAVISPTLGAANLERLSDTQVTLSRTLTLT